MMQVNSKFQHQKSEISPVYVDPNQMSDMDNVRLRHTKSNIPIEPKSQYANLILGTDDFQSNQRDNDLPLMSRNKHNIRQILLLIFTALSYLLYTLRAYIPDNIQTYSHFWLSMKPSSIRRVYTPDLRPDLVIENFLLRLAETCQTLWLVYILSYIPRRTHLGYVYRNPDIFNSFLCFLLISALSFQIISQMPIPSEISCACLLISFILLIIICRLVAVKLVKYEEKIKSIDLLIMHYFILNCLFLYTTTIVYLTICSSIENFIIYLDSYFKLPTLPTTIGLSSVFILLLIYFLLDRFVYENEFYSIWTPYLFITIIFICPPLRRLLSSDIYLITDGLNFYLLWILFSITIIMILIRLYRQIFIKYEEMKRKQRIHSFIEQVNFEIET
ncbi:unnamed protein product [Rotaria sordida]|uniref:Uncharacterized protein n=1 Tax=Rotaria sordida TaxID=392033 RepID=A0A814BI41_9BILA|nr:unnamed protein product [Rotaria sordida]CAF1010205.1 unnamed protein product [Rotaria sordida]CAF3774400.1 unnamed protein product [Rotaria sordida]CAF3782290.1 unnamed protein product [Rotaria sordida]